MDTEALIQCSREDLEWPELLERIAAHAVSELGRRRVLQLTPVSEQEQAELRLAVLGEALRLHQAGFALPCGVVVDLTEALERVRRQGVFSSEELGALLQLFGVTQALVRYGASHRESAPLLARMLQAEDELWPLQHRLSSCVDATGHILDEASPALRDARRDVVVLRRQVQTRIGELISRYREALQDGYFAEREGRYVLPVRADAPYRVDGMVLGTSGSGSTLYIEPQELGALGQKLRLAEAQVEREEARILVEWSETLAPWVDELLWALDLCVRADLLSACVRFAVQTGGRVVPFDEPGCLTVVEGRHPLLACGGEEVIPQNLCVRSGQALILSGPNAGGKTVALKTLGLFALLQATGLPIPAEEGTKIGFFQQIFSDVGDDQSLAQSLSTFSGHVERMRDFLHLAHEQTLVLVDEVMSGTDPNEGAVLAIAFLEALVRRGALAVATTHYEALKLYAASHESFENAAVGFDFELMQPTFLVEQGRPGASSALVVAARHGLPPALIERAEALLPEVDAERRREQIHLEAIRAQMEREKRELQTELERQRLVRHKLELEAEKLREARRSELAKESDELRRAVKQARAELKQMRQRLQQEERERAEKKDAELSSASLRDWERKLDQASSLVAFGSEVEKSTRKSPGPTGKPPKFSIGQKVRVAGLNVPAEVLQILEKGQVRVVAGVMKLTVAAQELQPWKGSAPSIPAGIKASALKRPPAVEAPPQLFKSRDVSLDLRGQRVEEALSEVDSFLDELLRRQERGGFILHGHGTGVLKEVVRQHLQGHPCVKESRPAERDEGGDAWTVVWLSDGVH